MRDRINRIPRFPSLEMSNPSGNPTPSSSYSNTSAVGPSSAIGLQETEILAGRPVGCAYFNELENSSAVIRPSGIATLNGTVWSRGQETENEGAAVVASALPSLWQISCKYMWS